MLVGLGVFGTALLYGDGIITPAISVLSAVEGLEEVVAAVHATGSSRSPSRILLGLFAVQRRGTGGIGKVFGPIMVVWFVVARRARGRQVVDAARDHRSRSTRSTRVRFFPNESTDGVPRARVAVFLVVTGGEALYADMGHFGRRPITLGWYAMVLPALVLNYWGQGALLLENPSFEGHRSPACSSTWRPRRCGCRW